VRPLRLRLGLLALALILGGALVLIENAALDLVLGRAPLEDGTLGSIDAPDVAVLHMVFTSLPLVVLALCARQSKRLWGTAIALILCFSAFATWSIWRASLIDFEGGADIGLGLIMLASPFLILFVLGILSVMTRRREPGGAPGS